VIEMKLLAVAIFAVLAVSAIAENEYPEPAWVEIDWKNVVPVQDMPGFWDNREIRPSFYPGDMTRTGRIVGGAIVTPPTATFHAHPYQTALLMSFAGGTGLCGGSKISQRAVLTAAHCPIGSGSTQVIFGAHQMTVVEAHQHRTTVPSSGYRIHAGYNPSNLNNDIAILITPGLVPTTVHIQPANLAPATAGTFAGELATVSGFGRISDASGATSAFLRSVQNNVITNAQCAATFGGIIVPSTICITTAGGRGTCNGDSGGPLTVGPHGSRIQIGVVSFGAAAGCEVGFPAGFARTSFYATWISTNMQP